VVASVIALTLLGGVVAVAGRAPVAGAAATTNRFVATTPCRLADVRSGAGVERIDAQTVRVFVAGRCGIPVDASAAAVTVTVDSSTTPGAGYVTIWPEGQPIPTASIVNYTQGQIRANGTIISIGAGGAVDLFTQNGAPVVVDVTGWFVPATTATSGRFVPIAPARAIDTRQPPRQAAMRAGETLRVALPAGVPTDASAVAITITATDSADAGFITVSPAGTPFPPTSVLNTDRRGQTRAAGTIVGVTPQGLDVYSLTGGHVIVDVTGWFTSDGAPDAGTGLFVPAVAPRRLLDTRSADPVWQSGEVEVANVAADASALVLNVTIVNPIQLGFLSAHAARQERPPTSTVNAMVRNEIAAAMAIVPTSTAGVGVYSNAGADVVVDYAGHFVGAPGAPTLSAPTNIRPPDCTTNTDADGLTALFRSGAAFTGADYQRQFTLPDGRILWMFQDVYVRGRGGQSKLVHNAGLVQTGACFTILQTGNFANPGAYLFADSTQFQQHWFWPLGGEVGSDGLFHVFVAEMRENGSTYLSKTEPLATWIVAIDPVSLQVVDRRKAVDSSASLYGWSVASDDTYSYLYAHCHRQFGWSAFPFVDPPVYVHDLTCSSKVEVARVPKGRFDQPLAYWNGSSWVANPSAAVSIVPGDRFVSAGQFYRRNGKWVSVTKIGDWFGDKILVETATSPQGPYTTVLSIPTPPACDDCNTYFASLVPYPDTTGRWIVGLSNNQYGDHDLSRYDPTFFTIAPV
jgi:hypothetical protein